MRRRTALLGALLCICAAVFCVSAPAVVTVLFREDFASLDRWRPVNFPKVKNHTTYTVETMDHEHYLRAESDASASALVFRHEFDVYQFPRARWRWKVDNLYATAQPGVRSGDDYPIRVYVIFKYDPEKASVIEKLEYETMKLLYGEYPPHSSLTYVWSSRAPVSRIMTSPYTNRARLIYLETGDRYLKTWRDEDVNIPEDYEKAFGRKPPNTAGIGIMNDSDDTGERAVSYIAFIEVYR